MSLQIKFELRAEGDEQPDAFLDAAERELLFASTRASISAGLQRKLRAVICGEHGGAPAITVSGVYDNATEQMELDYHIDTCCQAFLLRVVQILNQRA